MEIKRIDNIKSWELTSDVLTRVIMLGERVMLFLVEMKAGSVIPLHKHPNEQMGICLKGKAVFKANNETVIVEEGSTYRFNPNEEHSVKALTDSRFLDVFAPPREDYIERQRREDLLEKSM